MPPNYAGKFTNYKDDRGRYVGKNTKPGFAKGQVSPKAPKGPEEMKRDIRVCGARRTGKSSSGEGICCQPAGWGTDHVGIGRCKLHGGNLPSHQKSAIMEEAIVTVKKLYGEDIEIDPYEALMGEVRRTAGAVIWLQEHIRELEDPERLKQVTNSMGIQPSVWIQMYQQERAHLVRVAKTCIDAGIAERQVQIAEAQGRMIAAVLQAFLNDPELGLSPMQLSLGPKLIKKHILSIEGAEFQQTKSGETLPSIIEVDSEVKATTPGQTKPGGKLEQQDKARAARKKGTSRAKKQASPADEAES